MVLKGKGTINKERDHRKRKVAVEEAESYTLFLPQRSDGIYHLIINLHYLKLNLVLHFQSKFVNALKSQFQILGFGTYRTG